MDRTDKKIAEIVEYIKNTADESDIDDIFIHCWPVECEAKELNGSGRCKNKSNENCIKCKRNLNIFDEWKDKDFYEQIVD